MEVKVELEEEHSKDWAEVRECGSQDSTLIKGQKRTGTPLAYEKGNFLDCVFEWRRLGPTGSLAQPKSSLIFAPMISHHMFYFSVTLIPEEWGRLHTLDTLCLFLETQLFEGQSKCHFLIISSMIPASSSSSEVPDVNIILIYHLFHLAI